MQEQGRVTDYLGSSIRSTEHQTSLPTGHLSFWKNKTPGCNSPTEHYLRSCWGSYCFTRGGSTLTWETCEFMRSHHPLLQIATHKYSCTPHSSSISSLHPNFIHSQHFGKRLSSSSHSWTGRAQYWTLRALSLHSCNTYEQNRFSLQNNLSSIETFHPYSVLLSKNAKKVKGFLLQINRRITVCFVHSIKSKIIHLSHVLAYLCISVDRLFLDELRYKPVLKKLLY